MMVNLTAARTCFRPQWLVSPETCRSWCVVILWL